MRNLDTFVLCEEANERVRAKVWCKIVGGCMSVEGQDLGLAPMDSFGADEYEYFYDWDEANTEKLISLLNEEGRSLADVLKEKYGGLDGCSKLRDTCKEHGIEYKFSSWF